MASEWSLVCAAVQMRSTDDLAANLAICKAQIAAAALAGARLVVLPECFPFLGRKEGDKLVHAEDLDDDATRGPIVAMLADQAQRHRVWIIGGGMPERVGGDARRAYNTAIAIDPDGALRARYRKIHLFDVDIPGGAQLRESDGTRAGEPTPVVIDVDGARVGLSICYDLRFPELYRQMVKGDGAEVIVVPAAFTAHTGRAHWELLLRARAVENQAWVVAAAQWGRHNEKRETFGHSMVVDPWGTVVAQQADGDGVVVAKLDGATVAKTRAQMPCLDHAVMWPR